MAETPATALPLTTDAAAWMVVNDDVMGGVSRSRLLAAPLGLRFEGSLSLDFNGGFASARVPFDARAWLAARPGGAAAQAFVLQVRGDGRAYKFTAFVRAPGGGRAAHQFQAGFDTDGSAQQVVLPLTAFRASFRGRTVDVPPLRFGDIVAVGLQIADRRAGPFALELGQVAVQ